VNLKNRVAYAYGPLGLEIQMDRKSQSPQTWSNITKQCLLNFRKSWKFLNKVLTWYFK